MLKTIMKEIISKIGYLIPIRSSMSNSVGKNNLLQYCPKPNGSCYTKNSISMEYDLQIIIPVYNAEKYIEQCIKSVILQATDRYKILATIINDGSTDHTGIILEKLSHLNYKGINLEIIEQKNKGFSGARNAGLHNIKGRYITFLDSDDILIEGAMKRMLDAAYAWKADIVQGSWYTFCENNRNENLNPISGVAKDNKNNFSGYPWGKLYKYTVLEHFKFPDGYWFEDTPISFIIAAMPYKFAIIQELVYGYRINPNGITATALFKKKSLDSYWITEQCLEDLPKFGLTYDQRAYEYFLNQCIMNAGRIHLQPRKIRESVFVLTSELMSKYFAGFKTENTSLKQIEKSLLNKQFIKFEFLLLSM